MTINIKLGLFAISVAIAMIGPTFAQVLNVESTEASTGSSAPSNFSQTTSVFENWSVQCREEADKKFCYSETVIRQSKPTVRDLLVLRISKGVDGLNMVIVTPNRVKLANGISFKSNDDTLMTAPFIICGATNCSAQQALTGETLAALSGQQQALVSFFIFSTESEGGEREIKMPVSFAGFAAALENLAANE